jgi:hypothetical protein
MHLEHCAKWPPDAAATSMKLQQKLAVERIPDRLRGAGEPVEQLYEQSQDSARTCQALRTAYGKPCAPTCDPPAIFRPYIVSE